MAFFGLVNKSKPKTKRIIKVQGMSTGEGMYPELDLSSLLNGMLHRDEIPGTCNNYTTYDGQVSETYRKYNGFADFGAPQTREVVDLRTAFIVGEGLNVECKNDATSEWIAEFLEQTGLNGARAVECVKGGEMAGQVILLLKAKNNNDELKIKFGKRVYNPEAKFRVTYTDPEFPDEVAFIEVQENNTWKKLQISNFVYVRTGGDDSNTRGPTTKVGLVLNEMENYDRAIKDIRRNNYVSARATPVFSTETQQGADALTKKINEGKWKIGKAIVGAKTDLKYVSPTTGASENLKHEIETSVKTISGTTGIPVHWMGYVDLMSNRSVADSLYELVKSQTATERSSWEAAFYSLICKAMELYVDNGGQLNYDEGFSVTLPLLDMAQFYTKIQGYSLALADGIISKADYRNEFPGIDPIQTVKDLKTEKEEAEKDLPAPSFADRKALEDNLKKLGKGKGAPINDPPMEDK